ncbi:hypothetical protein [Leeia oryzae]|uniref:hypothetical protein n=1 Tax=Leeia oryzae TaxID=356662 RepID=UPI0003665882|nr:hypothetical protein [Leeia oryzae]
MCSKTPVYQKNHIFQKLGLFYALAILNDNVLGLVLVRAVALFVLSFKNHKNEVLIPEKQGKNAVWVIKTRVFCSGGTAGKQAPGKVPANEPKRNLGGGQTG